jgi:hypothetical protein
MSLKRSSTIVGPRADVLADALESVVGDELQMVAEYDARSYRLLHVADSVEAQCGGIDAVEGEAESLFNYYHIDFLERDLLADVLWLGEVNTFVTYLDHGIVVRATGDSAAVFVALDVTASVDDVQITIQNTLQSPEE